MLGLTHPPAGAIVLVYLMGVFGPFPLSLTLALCCCARSCFDRFRIPPPLCISRAHCLTRSDHRSCLPGARGLHLLCALRAAPPTKSLAYRPSCRGQSLSRSGRWASSSTFRPTSAALSSSCVPLSSTTPFLSAPPTRASGSPAASHGSSSGRVTRHACAGPHMLENSRGGGVLEEEFFNHYKNDLKRHAHTLTGAG